MARVTLKMDVHNERSAKKIRKGLKNYVGGVERVEASVDSGLVVVWGSADAETLRLVLESLMKKTVTIVPEPEESPAPAAQSSSGPPPAAPGPPPQYYPQPMWPPPPQYYGQQPPPPQYYQPPPPPQYYQPPPSDHPQYATPPPPPHYDPYSTTEGGSSGYHSYNPHPAGPRHGENQSTCSIQ